LAQGHWHDCTHVYNTRSLLSRITYTATQCHMAYSMLILSIVFIPIVADGIRLSRDWPGHDHIDATQRNTVEDMPGLGDLTDYSDDADDFKDDSVVSTMLSVFEEDAGTHLRKRAPVLQTVAVVAVGHVRTFVLPGVHSSIKTNLLGTFPGTAHFYFVGHLGRYVDWFTHGARDVDVASYLNRRFNGSEENAIASALDTMAEYSTHVEIHAGCACDDLLRAREKYGITGPPCDTARKNLMQVLWMDYAFKQTEKRGPYDLIFRIRPDVAVFKQFPWHSISADTINYVKKFIWQDGVADWHFAFPFLYLNKTWPAVVQKFIIKSTSGPYSGPGWSPDMVWHFPQPFAPVGNVVNFTSVVVRSPISANCDHIDDETLRNDCKLKCRTCKDNWPLALECQACKGICYFMEKH